VVLTISNRLPASGEDLLYRVWIDQLVDSPCGQAIDSCTECVRRNKSVSNPQGIDTNGLSGSRNKKKKGYGDEDLATSSAHNTELCSRNLALRNDLIQSFHWTRMGEFVLGLPNAESHLTP